MDSKSIDSLKEIRFLSDHAVYCSILAIIETLKRRNMRIIENAKQSFMGVQVIF